MKVLIAGGSGVLGARLIPILVAAGYDVAGTTHSPHKLESLADLGAEPVLLDILSTDSVMEAVSHTHPNVLVNLVTHLPDSVEQVRLYAPENNMVRRVGTANLLAAAGDGVSAFVAQSVAWDLGGEGQRSVEEMEDLVLRAQGIVIRYGRFYGPGTYYPVDPPLDPRIHVDIAAARTLQALTSASGIVTIAEGWLEG